MSRTIRARMVLVEVEMIDNHVTRRKLLCQAILRYHLQAYGIGGEGAEIARIVPANDERMLWTNFERMTIKQMH